MACVSCSEREGSCWTAVSTALNPVVDDTLRDLDVALGGQRKVVDPIGENHEVLNDAVEMRVALVGEVERQQIPNCPDDGTRSHRYGATLPQRTDGYVHEADERFNRKQRR